MQQVKTFISFFNIFSSLAPSIFLLNYFQGKIDFANPDVLNLSNLLSDYETKIESASTSNLNRSIDEAIDKLTDPALSNLKEVSRAAKIYIFYIYTILTEINILGA